MSLSFHGRTGVALLGLRVARFTSLFSVFTRSSKSLHSTGTVVLRDIITGTLLSTPYCHESSAYSWGFSRPEPHLSRVSHSDVHHPICLDDRNDVLSIYLTINVLSCSHPRLAPAMTTLSQSQPHIPTVIRTHSQPWTEFGIQAGTWLGLHIPSGLSCGHEC
jgi:hypothetical protein